MTQKGNWFLGRRVREGAQSGRDQAKPKCLGWGGHQKIPPPSRMVSHTYCAVLGDYIDSCSWLGALRGLDTSHASARRLYEA